MRSTLLSVALLSMAAAAAPLAGCSGTAGPSYSSDYDSNGYVQAQPVDYQQPYYAQQPTPVYNNNYGYRDYDHRDYDHRERHYDRYDEHEFGRAREELRNAYATLAVANHNYHWHRVDAMNHLRHALQLMGTDIAGNGRGHERQAVSNDQLRHTAVALDQLRDRIHIHHPQIAAEIGAAAREVHLALESRH